MPHVQYINLIIIVKGFSNWLTVFIRPRLKMFFLFPTSDSQLTLTQVYLKKFTTHLVHHLVHHLSGKKKKQLHEVSYILGKEALKLSKILLWPPKITKLLVLSFFIINAKWFNILLSNIMHFNSGYFFRPLYNLYKE